MSTGVRTSFGPLRRAGLSTRCSGSPTLDRAHKSIAVPVSGTALLLIDVINDLAFKGSYALVAQAEPMALRLATLKRRTRSTPARDAPHPPCDLDGDRGQHLRPLHRQRCLHARSQAVRSRRLHRVEHGRGQRPRAATDCERAQRRHHRFIPTDIPPCAARHGRNRTAETGVKTISSELDKFYGLIDEIRVAMMTTSPSTAISSRAPWPTRNVPAATTCGS
jgi:hypothetical protein